MTLQLFIKREPARQGVEHYLTSIPEAGLAGEFVVNRRGGRRPVYQWHRESGEMEAKDIMLITLANATMDAWYQPDSQVQEATLSLDEEQAPKAMCDFLRQSNILHADGVH